MDQSYVQFLNKVIFILFFLLTITHAPFQEADSNDAQKIGHISPFIPLSSLRAELSPTLM